MRKITLVVALTCLGLTLTPLTAWSQVRTQRGGDNPLYKLTINIVERTTPAINYRHRSGWTLIDFRGTPLLSDAKGEAKIDSKQGAMEIDTVFHHLQPATRFGPEYLTYVMWAITPEGRPINLGEVILNGSDSKLKVTTDMQAFGLIVTAEPYFAVTQPSNVVVLENVVRTDTVGKIEAVDAKYELLERGEYTLNVPPSQLMPIALDSKTPLDLYEARNAVRIASWAGADKDAPDTFQKAQSLVDQAEGYKARNARSKPISTVAREAVQTAEDARQIALKRQAEMRAEKERQEAAERENQARLQAESAREAAEQQAANRAQAEAEARRIRAQADLERQQLQSEANRAREEALRADEQRARAEHDKAQLRQQLVEQLNLILETRDTARGLIVNMSDVLFDSGKYTLKPGAREKLAKIAGIVISHAGLRLQVEGHTDSVGSDDYNQELSEKRAEAVRAFLIHEGVGPDMISATGYGKTLPVADNATAAGRQQNRRVEMVVSGDLIGQPLTKPSSHQ